VFRRNMFVNCCALCDCDDV